MGCRANRRPIHAPIDGQGQCSRPPVAELADHLSNQRGVTIDYRVIGGADHFFNEHLDVLTGHMEDYLDKHYVPVGGDAED